ncbi:MAG TPA: permease-like cell division protein FtsX [Cytophagaceae bacterium]|jgi:cell division transport system permease protein|nr:permease-like cell division protein FtsX [Cytophagaceae bacterium]
MGSAKKLYRNKKTLGSYPSFTVMFSITLSMIVIGLLGLILSHAQKLSNLVKESIEVNIFLKNETNDSLRNVLQATLSRRNYVLQKGNQAQITYVSKEEARKKFSDTYGEDFTKVLEENPLYASYSVKIRPEYSDSLNMKKIAEQITAMDGVREVYYQEALINKINKNIKTVSAVLAVFGFILLFASVVLINNTIKLALYSQRFLIRSMQLVGATKWFIQRPFLLRTLVQGMISGMIASGLLYALMHFAYGELKELNELRQDDQLVFVYGGLVVLGALIGFMSSFRAVNTYLKMSLDELY